MLSPNVPAEALYSVAFRQWLAIRCEAHVKLNDALRNMAIKRHGEEHLFRYSRMDKPRDVPEPEAPVVLRMSHEAASLGTKTL